MTHTLFVLLFIQWVSQVYYYKCYKTSLSKKMLMFTWFTSFVKVILTQLFKSMFKSGHPDKSSFMSTHRKICQYGLVKRNEREIKLFNCAAIQLNMSNKQVFEAMKLVSSKPFHLQPVQNLFPGNAGI